MEKRDRLQAPVVHRQRRNSPSFSSSLLDAIYRSIDDPNNNSPAPTLSDEQSFSAHYKFAPPPPMRVAHSPPGVHHHRHPFGHSSSSNSSSFGGFSSSDVDSTSRSRPPAPSGYPPAESPAAVPKKKRSSIRSRIRDLRRPDSPGSRLASLFNTFFFTASRSAKAKKVPVGGTTSVSYSTSSTASSCVRKPPPSSGCCGKKFSARFFAVGDKQTDAPAASSERDRRRMAEMVLRELEIKVEEEDSDFESESSSELFELGSLAVAGRFADELPVYETTNVETNLAISNGLIP